MVYNSIDEYLEKSMETYLESLTNPEVNLATLEEAAIFQKRTDRVIAAAEAQATKIKSGETPVPARFKKMDTEKINKLLDVLNNTEVKVDKALDKYDNNCKFVKAMKNLGFYITKFGTSAVASVTTGIVLNKATKNTPKSPGLTMAKSFGTTMTGLTAKDIAEDLYSEIFPKNWQTTLTLGQAKANVIITKAYVEKVLNGEEVNKVINESEVNNMNEALVEQYLDCLVNPESDFVDVIALESQLLESSFHRDAYLAQAYKVANEIKSGKREPKAKFEKLAKEKPEKLAKLLSKAKETLIKVDKGIEKYDKNTGFTKFFKDVGDDMGNTIIVSNDLATMITHNIMAALIRSCFPTNWKGHMTLSQAKTNLIINIASMEKALQDSKSETVNESEVNTMNEALLQIYLEQVTNVDADCKVITTLEEGFGTKESNKLIESAKEKAAKIKSGEIPVKKKYRKADKFKLSKMLAKAKETESKVDKGLAKYGANSKFVQVMKDLGLIVPVASKLQTAGNSIAATAVASGSVAMTGGAIAGAAIGLGALALLYKAIFPKNWQSDMTLSTAKANLVINIAHMEKALSTKDTEATTESFSDVNIEAFAVCEGAYMLAQGNIEEAAKLVCEGFTDSASVPFDGAAISGHIETLKAFTNKMTNEMQKTNNADEIKKVINASDILLNDTKSYKEKEDAIVAGDADVKCPHTKAAIATVEKRLSDIKEDANKKVTESLSFLDLLDLI